VRLETQLHLIDRAKRYSAWQGSGAAVSNGNDFQKEFEEAILLHARRTAEPLDAAASALKQVKRLASLFRMLSWEQRPPFDETRYMKIEGGDEERFGDRNEYRKQFVLPSPEGVVAQRPPGKPSAQPGRRPFRGPGEDRRGGFGNPPRLRQ
jgi:hypothetical protein